MKPITDILEHRISAAIQAAAGIQAPALVRPAADTKFGDYQANGIMAAPNTSRQSRTGRTGWSGNGILTT